MAFVRPVRTTGFRLPFGAVSSPRLRLYIGEGGLNVLETPAGPAGALRFDKAGLGLAELNFRDGLMDAGSGSDPYIIQDKNISNENIVTQPKYAHCRVYQISLRLWK
jgi:hypothetical protein